MSRQINCTLLGNGTPVPKDTALEAWINNDDVHPILFDGVVEEDGRLIFRLPDLKPTGGATIHVSLDGYVDWVGRTIIPLENASEGPKIELILEVSDLPRIHTEGVKFVDEYGRPWLWKGSTDFLLYQKYLQGEDIGPILIERRMAGANLVRVFGMCHNIIRFYPQEYGNYYDMLVSFATYLSQHGLYLEFVVFADQQYVKVNAQVHYQACCDQLRLVDNVFLELCNEYPKNGIDPHDFTRPYGILASAGSDLSDASPDIYWNFFGWHGRRDWPKISNLDDAYGIAKKYNIPVVHDEPIGTNEVDQPGRRTTSALAMQSVASESARLGAGGTYHSEAGLRSLPWGLTQTRLANVFFNALEVE